MEGLEAGIRETLWAMLGIWDLGELIGANAEAGGGELEGVPPATPVVPTYCPRQFSEGGSGIAIKSDFLSWIPNISLEQTRKRGS